MNYISRLFHRVFNTLKFRRATLVLSVAAGLVLGAVGAFPAVAAASSTLERVESAYANEDSSPDTQAGSHPFQTTFTITTTTTDTKDIAVKLPPGFLTDTNVLPQCPTAKFDEILFEHFDGCPADTVIGVARVVVAGEHLVPVVNLVPSPGQPARLGFEVASFPVSIDASVRTGAGYGAVATSSNIQQLEGLQEVNLTIWGDPADPVHNPVRGSACLLEFEQGREQLEYLEREYGLPPCEAPQNLIPSAFVTLPTSCSGAAGLTISANADLWAEPGVFPSEEVQYTPADGLDGCNAEPFSPTISSKPTTDLADSPSGLEFDLHVPQSESPTEPATAHLKKAVVTLPPGLVVNPSSADGLAGCSSAQIGLTSAPGATPVTTTPGAAECPTASKIGTVEVDSPLLAERNEENEVLRNGEGKIIPRPIKGAVYIAKPFDNPFNSLLAIYIAIHDPQSGVVVKLAGHVVPDPKTGQLTATFDEGPQLPFEDFKLDFFGGPRAALRTPATCGKYTTTSDMTPWSTPEGADAFPADSFETNTAASGSGACPSSEAQASNAPSFNAQTITPKAGAYSPFTLHLARADGSQQLGAIDTTLPPGLTGKLAGVQECSEAQIAVAESRSKPNQGALEQSSPSCPAASEVGTVDVGAGAGTAPYHVTGHAYLAGPYKGAPLSLAIITPAVAGPFDLGTVVVRTALYVNPETAQIHAVSDKFPQILDGIPLDLRSVALNMSRPSFTLNPTSCDPLSFLGSSISALGQSAALTSPFQVGECGKLGFKPKVALKLKGGTKRNKNPALRAVVTYPKGSYANIASAQVTLPDSEFLDQAHIGTVCTRVQFAAKACPAASIYGHATASTPLLDQPLSGPVYLRSSSHKLPDLVADLNGQIEVTLAGKVDTGKGGGIRNTFELVPDAPVSKFVLSMQGGNKGLLVNSENICKKPQKATVHLTAQNGKVSDTTPLIANSCGGKGKKHHAHRTAR